MATELPPGFLPGLSTLSRFSCRLGGFELLRSGIYRRGFGISVGPHPGSRKEILTEADNCRLRRTGLPTMTFQEDVLRLMSLNR